jgi:uncharacterized protein (DUF1697 family)
MADLRRELTARGLQNVRTYIQSGNVVYDAPKGATSTADALRAEAAAISEAIDHLRGISPVVIVLDAKVVARHLASSPHRSEDPSKTFLVFVDGDAAELGDLGSLAANGERLAEIDGVLHLYCPNGIGRSKLGERLAGAKRPPTTTRNLRTVAKILELAAG